MDKDPTVVKNAQILPEAIVMERWRVDTSAAQSNKDTPRGQKYIQHTHTHTRSRRHSGLGVRAARCPETVDSSHST